MKPLFVHSKEPIEVKMSTIIGRGLPESEDISDRMICVSIIHDKGETMTKSYGNSNYQAEKNASILGLQWLRENKRAEIETLLQNSLFS